MQNRFKSSWAAAVLAATLTLPMSAQAAEPKPSVRPVAEQTQRQTAVNQRVNINTASAAELSEKLVGVGKSKAEAIVSWRKANGRFKSPNQLMDVKGIGPSLFEKNKGKIQI